MQYKKENMPDERCGIILGQVINKNYRKKLNEYKSITYLDLQHVVTCDRGGVLGVLGEK